MPKILKSTEKNFRSNEMVVILHCKASSNFDLFKNYSHSFFH